MTTAGETAVRDRLRLEPGWRDALAPAFATPDAERLRDLLRVEAAAGRAVFPPRDQMFAAFDRTPLDRVEVVVVGQDPYHGPGQAMGLSFSVPRGVDVPPSLRNVLTEIEQDLELPRPAHGDLTAWADRGVLLLNTSLSVRAHAAASHSASGWQTITDAAIRAVSDRRSAVAFLLWGRHAQAKAPLVDASRHLVLRAAHPSPLSATKGFFGCRHFSRVNEWRAERGLDPIDWSLPA